MREVAKLLGWIDDDSTAQEATVATARARRTLQRIQASKRKAGQPALLFRQVSCKRKGAPWYTTLPMLERYCGEMVDRRAYIDRQVAAIAEKHLDDGRTTKALVMALGARLRKLEKSVAKLANLADEERQRRAQK
jgi:hypothetical protein